MSWARGRGAIEADLAAPGAAAEVLDAAPARLARVLVNNAAHSVNAGFAEVDAATLDAHYAVNVRTRCCSAASSRGAIRRASPAGSCA